MQGRAPCRLGRPGRIRRGAAGERCRQQVASLLVRLDAYDGRRDSAVRRLEEAKDRYTALDQALHALACDIQIARLQGISDDDLIAELAAAGARDPDRWVRAYLPAVAV